MSRQSDALMDLTRELADVTGKRPDELWDTCRRWFANHFDEFHITSHIDLVELVNARDQENDLKAYMVRRATMDAALKICAATATGREAVKMSWEAKDYRPAWQTIKDMPVMELQLDFIAMRRAPRAWYHEESADAWLKRLSK